MSKLGKFAVACAATAMTARNNVQAELTLDDLFRE